MAGTHVALIRGINVGRAKRVAMADLRELMQAIGCRDVRTLANSGNIVYTAAGRGGDRSARLEKAMATDLGVAARVIALTRDEIAAAIRHNPLRSVGTDPSRLHVAVPAAAGDRALLEPLARQEWAPEALALGARVAFLSCPQGVLKSRLAAAVQKALGDRVTMRTWAIFTRLHEMLEASQ
jgi:uncharacterized protein (DUF1697 family)